MPKKTKAIKKTDEGKAWNRKSKPTTVDLIREDLKVEKLNVHLSNRLK